MGRLGGWELGPWLDSVPRPQSPKVAGHCPREEGLHLHLTLPWAPAVDDLGGSDGGPCLRFHFCRVLRGCCCFIPSARQVSLLPPPRLCRHFIFGTAGSGADVVLQGGTAGEREAEPGLSGHTGARERESLLPSCPPPIPCKLQRNVQLPRPRTSCSFLELSSSW